MSDEQKIQILRDALLLIAHHGDGYSRSQALNALGRARLQ